MARARTALLSVPMRSIGTDSALGPCGYRCLHVSVALLIVLHGGVLGLLLNQRSLRAAQDAETLAAAKQLKREAAQLQNKVAMVRAASGSMQEQAALLRQKETAASLELQTVSSSQQKIQKQEDVLRVFQRSVGEHLKQAAGQRQQEFAKLGPPTTPRPGSFVDAGPVDPTTASWKAINVYVGLPEVYLGTKNKQLQSQVGQDWLVGSMLNCKRGGYFIDLAANDAEIISNSLLLERDMGWRGVCMEANQEYIYKLAHRKCDVVIGVAGGPSDQEVTFTLNGAFGGIVGQGMDNFQASSNPANNIVMRTVPLHRVLEKVSAPSRIDYFSLDVEGAETVVMHGFDWEKYRFTILTVERPKPELIKMFSEAGYEIIRQNGEFGDYTYMDTRYSDFAQLKAAWANHPDQPLPRTCMTELGYPTPDNVEKAGIWFKLMP